MFYLGNEKSVARKIKSHPPSSGPSYYSLVSLVSVMCHGLKRKPAKLQRVFFVFFFKFTAAFKVFPLINGISNKSGGSHEIGSAW